MHTHRSLRQCGKHVCLETYAARRRQSFYYSCFKHSAQTKCIPESVWSTALASSLPSQAGSVANCWNPLPIDLALSAAMAVL